MLVTESERLIIRHFYINDLEAMDSVLGDTEVMRFSNGVLTQDGIRNWLNDCFISYKIYGYGPWALVEKNIQRTIGYCGIFHFPDIDGKPENEIGFRLAKQYWGMGYATEAALSVRNYSFKNLGITRLIAIVDPNNKASIRVSKKMGMHYEKDIMLNGYTHPDHIYAVSSSEICLTSRCRRSP